MLKAEEEQQEHITLHNSLLTASTTTTKTPYMHHVTTTALPAVGRCSNSGNSSIASSNASNSVPSSTGSNLSSAAVLLGILNQTGSCQSGSVIATTTAAATGITSTSNIIRRMPTTPGSILNPKALSEPQIPLDYLKTAPDLTRNLPDLLKVISEASVKSTESVSLNQAKALLTGDNESLKTLDNTSHSKLRDKEIQKYSYFTTLSSRSVLSNVHCVSVADLFYRA